MKTPMKLICIILAMALAADLSATAKTLDWPIDATTAGARQFAAYHGETVRFNLQFMGAMTNLAPVCIYYQTNGMGKAEWFEPIPGTVFHPTNDCGAAFYRFFIRCTDPDGINYTANGSLRMLDSPGFEPSAVPLPVRTLDFSKIEVLNPPWGGVDAATVTNIVLDVAPAPGDYAAVSNAAMNAANLVSSSTNALDASLSSRLSHASRAATDYTDSATNGIGQALADVAGEVDGLRFAKLYPDGSVTSPADFTSGIKYDFNDASRTAAVKPFCNTGNADNDNSSLSGRVVIPPFVDAEGGPHVSDDGTRYKVTAVANDNGYDRWPNDGIYAIVAPTTVTSIGDHAFSYCPDLWSVSFPAATSIGKYAFYAGGTLGSISLPAATSIGARAFASCHLLASVSLPAATSIGDLAFWKCSSLESVSLPAATSIGANAFYNCTSLSSVSFPAATSIGRYAFRYCSSLAAVDFGGKARASVPTAASGFDDIPSSCKFVVPDSQYAAWTAASGWSDLVAAGHPFLRHSEWEYARRYELGAVAGLLDVVNVDRVQLSGEAAARGVTFTHSKGDDQNVAIEIGRGAVAAVDEAAANAAPSNTVLRSVSVAIGANAVARANATSSQAIAVGWNAQATGVNAIAIGSGAQHPDETAMTGDATVASGPTSISMGYGAKSTAKNAVQLGQGVNSEADTLKFFDVTVVKDGKVAAGLDTNAVFAAISDSLDPQVIEEFPDGFEAELSVKSHAVTTLAATNNTVGPGYEAYLTPTGSRNFEVYMANTETNRRGLPVSFATDFPGGRILGPWAKRKVKTLPFKVRTIEPVPKTLVLEVETYDDGWDWTPVVAGAYSTNGTTHVEGTNLQFAAFYQVGSGPTNRVLSALYDTLDIYSPDAAEGETIRIFGEDGEEIGSAEIGSAPAIRQGARDGTGGATR